MLPSSACNGDTVAISSARAAVYLIGSAVRARDRTLVVLDCATVNSGERTGHDLAIVAGAPQIRNDF